MKKINKKILAILMLVLTIFSTFQNFVFAEKLNESNLYSKGECGNHLQYWNADKNMWYYVTCYYTAYSEGGREYPAYCVNKEYPGVGEYDGYTVDITGLFDNVQLWRTVINGFPYKSASELGLDNDYDAYIATKQAVYSILYNRDVYSFYRGGDERGTKIVNAMAYMVNEGRNGTRTPSSANVTANKVGNLVEDGNYYSQTYSVSSIVDMSNYTITSVANLPEYCKITNINGNEQTTFNGGENFKIMIPKDKMTADINAVINVQAKCKTYPVFYGKTRIENTQNYLVTYDPYGDEIGRANFNVKMNTGKIQINKTDDETSQAISGVTFQLLKQDGTIVANATTNEQGIATFSALYQGKYILKETATNEKYILNNKQFDVDVIYNKTTTMDIENEHKKGDLKVFKVDKDNNRIVLGNVEFDLFSEEFNRIIGTYKTDVNGEIKINNLRIGNYKLIEKVTNKWYNLAEDTEIQVEWNNITNATIENELKKGQIKVVKIDTDNNEVKLAGVTFEVLDENKNVLEKIVTDENGEALTSKYPVRDFEKLTIRESETLENYVLTEESQTIVLQENQIQTATFQNEKKKGQIKVIKTDLDNKEIVIPNVEFKVYDEQNNIVDTLITDEKGEATSRKLPIDQKYKVQETKTGKWYVLQEEPQTVELKQDEITELHFTNEKKKGQVKVVKVDKDKKEVRIAGVEFKIYDEQNNIVDTLITDEKGEATSRKLPIDQNYRVQESKTLENYVLTEEPQTVVLKQDEIENLIFENEKIKGYISITKYSSENNKYSELAKGVKLEGAEFEIYDSNNNLVDTIITDKTGVAKSKELLKGRYTIKEIKAPLYYIVNENTFETEIINHRETVNVDITDDNVDIDVEVEKTGFVETQSEDTIYYDFKNIKNNSNVYLDTFVWKDTLPINALRLEKIFTGTWNQDLTYSVWYKTNLNDYRMIRENLNTNTNYEINFADIKLQVGEYITDYEFRFGKVDTGFMEQEAPRIYCRMLKNLPNGFIFTNTTKVYGTYFEKYTEDEDNWTTVVYDKDIQLTKLPRTGY